MLRLVLALSLALVTSLASVSAASANPLSLGIRLETSQTRWGKRVVPIHLSKSLLDFIPGSSRSEIETIVWDSLKEWSARSGLKFSVSWTEATSVSSADARDGQNLVTVSPTAENLLLFQQTASQDAGRTRIFLDRRGNIAEADIVLNPYQRFSFAGELGTFDFQSVLTHELGHLLGLKHSPVLGSTMSDSIVKNGTFGLTAFGARTLAADDLSAVRELYGSTESACCGSVSGIFGGTLPTGGRLAVWLEDPASGRVIAGRFADVDGNFSIGGLPAGSFILRAQDSSRSGKRSIVPFEAIVDISIGAATTIRQNLKSTSARLVAGGIGFNGDLSFASVAANQGRTYAFMLSTRKGIEEKFTVVSSSSNIRVSNERLFEGSSTNDAIVDFNLTIPADVESGEYSFVLEDRKGRKFFLIGALSVGDSPNPWSIF
jgi:hypothetical protein